MFFTHACMNCTGRYIPAAIVRKRRGESISAKADGKLRPLGIATLEDKIVQQAVVKVLSMIYEEDFLGFSCGFRAGRSQHDALDALTVGIKSHRVAWILDADIQAFFGKR